MANWNKNEFKLNVLTLWLFVTFSYQQSDLICHQVCSWILPGHVRKVIF